MTTYSATAPLVPSGLADVHPGVERPVYDRDALTPSILHIGVGGFHRAHLATYAHELAQQGDLRWGIVGAGVLESDGPMAEVLGAQGGLYTLITRGNEQTGAEVIGSIVDYIHAHPDPSVLIERVADPATQIISLTITEGGYPVDDRTGDYEPDARVAGADGTFGLLARGLLARRDAGAGPVTVLSCDNIIANGRVSRTALRGEAAAFGPALLAWIDDNVTFPNSMVDRITPATSDDDRAWLADEYGLGDAWPVATEPFRQWVVEDSFAGARPPFEQLDVIVTDDVEPYELMKLRLLNAGHSCLAYLAALDGIERVDEALATPELQSYLEDFLVREARPVLPPIPDIDLDDYIESLILRFANPRIGDQISRLCLDGSAKFPKFLLPTIRRQLDRGGPIDGAAMALAGWCEYLRSDGPLAADPLLEVATAHAVASTDEPAAFLEFGDVFDAELAGDDRFRQTFTTALRRLRTHGVRSALSMTYGEDGAAE